MREIRAGDRVLITDRSDRYQGQRGTVERGEYAGILTGRLMVDVVIDGQTETYATGYYLAQVELLEAVAA